MQQEILEIPRALRLMLSKGLSPYGELLRRVAWSERPVFITGSDSSYWAALTGAYSFESLVRLPAVARTPEVFTAYTSPALAFRSLLIAVCPSGEDERTLAAVQAAKKRGALVWGLTAQPASRLGELADGIAPLYLHEAPAEGVQSSFCQHAAMLFLALAVARALNRPTAEVKAQEAELEKLPENIERVQNQFTEGARVLADEFRSLRRLWLIGGGFYHPAAMQAAGHLAKTAGLTARGLELAHFHYALPTLREVETGIMFFSGSRCALKSEVHQAVEGAGKIAGRKLFAITDSNDRQLSGKTAMSVLLPTLLEPGGALLALAFLNCTTYFAAGQPGESSHRSRRRASS